MRTSQVGPLTGGNTTNFALEAEENVCTKQARLVLWDDIKDCPPKELKISPIAAIPHKSKVFRSILDLSFRLRLKNGGVKESVNETAEKTSSAGEIVGSRPGKKPN